MRRDLSATISAVAVSLLLAGSASAATNLVANGNFETNGGSGQVNFNTTLASWTVNPGKSNYDFLFGPGAGTSGTMADTIGDIGTHGLLKFWGPGDGANNGLSLSPAGGYFLAVDPVYINHPISQQITGLKIGKQYDLSFYYAGAQQWKFKGPTTEGWQVSLGANTQFTNTLSNPNHGFTGWNQANMKFVATGASEKLAFLATGGPLASFPPFALLDGVSLTAVPEPATWSLMILGFGGVGALIRNNRRRAIAAA